MLLCILFIIGCASITWAAGLVINEVQSANSKTFADEDGDHSDWIEIYNAGTTAVNLNGYGLSDTTSTPLKWTFPSVTIQPGAYLLVFASDKNRKTGPYLHANFAIKQSGEPILISLPNGTLVDKMPATDIPQDMSYGRKPDGKSNWYYFATPTPKSANTTTGYDGVLPQPTFSKQRGFYNDDFNLTLSTTTPGAEIRYTTDGSLPTASSALYTSPIPIQATSWGAGREFKANVIRAACYKSGYITINPVTNTYFVGPNAASRYTLPIVSLTTDNANFFDNSIGIYVSGYYNNYNQTGDAWERPLHIEFFEPGSSTGFSVDGGVRINGGWTRNLAQKSLRLYADHQNGPGSFNYKVFPDSPITDYKRLILRNSGNDNQAASGAFTLIRDGFQQSLLKGLDVDIQNYRPALMFFNGEYWGIYSIAEREDKCYLENHFGTDPDNVDILAQIAFSGVEIQEGDTVAYDNLLSFIRNNDLCNQSNYEYAKTKMDISDIAIHHLMNIYIANTDWPGNNIVFWRPRTDTGKWRWAIHDTDFGFGLANSTSHDTLGYCTARGGTSFPNPDSNTITIASLLRNREFRDEFINRMADMMNTVFLPSTVSAKVDTMSAAIAPEVADHLARWGGGSVSTWANNIQSLKSWGNSRPSYVRNQFVKFFSLSGTANVSVNVSPANAGTVTFSTVAIPTGSYPWAGTYFQDIPIKVNAVPANGYHFARWQETGLGTQNPATITLSGDSAITAVFEAN